MLDNPAEVNEDLVQKRLLLVRGFTTTKVCSKKMQVRHGIGGCWSELVCGCLPDHHWATARNLVWPEVPKLRYLLGFEVLRVPSLGVTTMQHLSKSNFGAFQTKKQ